jgi:hypothetical protein
MLMDLIKVDICDFFREIFLLQIPIKKKGIKIIGKGEKK